MITSVQEIKDIKEIVAEVKSGLEEQGIPFGSVEQGIMIETPAAAVISDLLAEEVDFFSIGTNDLTQYTLAVDRQNNKLDRFYDAHHEAILRLIRHIVENAQRASGREYAESLERIWSLRKSSWKWEWMNCRFPPDVFFQSVEL